MMHGKGDGTSRPAAQKSCLLLTDFLITSFHSLLHQRLFSARAPGNLSFSRPNWHVICRDLVEQV
jgi:hypothetical protein